MSRPITTGLVQFAPEIGNVESNLEQMIKFTEEASQQGAQMVIFSELALTGYNQDLLGDNLVKLAITVEDEPIQRLAQAARKSNVFMVVGYLERRTVPGVVYNSIVMIETDGSILGSYAKSHLFSGEALHFRQGPVLGGAVQTSLGVVGPMICMDIGYPEVARILALQGAELLIAPSAWIKEDEDLWSLLLQSRALDNLSFVIGVNHTGVEGNLRFIGQSMVVDPRGHVINSLGADEGILITTIDLDDVVAARQRAPRFMLRRPELYGPIAEEH